MGPTRTLICTAGSHNYNGPIPYPDSTQEKVNHPYPSPNINPSTDPEAIPSLSSNLYIYVPTPLPPIN